MLETLFARQTQGITFLRMTCCGLVLGALIQARCWLRRAKPQLEFLWDAMTAFALCACALPVLAASGEDGLRAYALLGLLIGMTIYAAGVRHAADALAEKIRKVRKNIFSQKQEVAHAMGNKQRIHADQEMK